MGNLSFTSPSKEGNLEYYVKFTNFSDSEMNAQKILIENENKRSIEHSLVISFIMAGNFTLASKLYNQFDVANVQTSAFKPRGSRTSKSPKQTSPFKAR